MIGEGQGAKGDRETGRRGDKEIGDWVELRDERGKLCARLEVGRALLEVRRNERTVVFDLREFVRISEF